MVPDPRDSWVFWAQISAELPGSGMADRHVVCWRLAQLLQACGVWGMGCDGRPKFSGMCHKASLSPQVLLCCCEIKAGSRRHAAAAFVVFVFRRMAWIGSWIARHRPQEKRLLDLEQGPPSGHHTRGPTFGFQMRSGEGV
jgi:hypothetical protein